MNYIKVRHTKEKMCSTLLQFQSANILQQDLFLHLWICASALYSSTPIFNELLTRLFPVHSDRFIWNIQTNISIMLLKDKNKCTAVKSPCWLCSLPSVNVHIVQISSCYKNVPMLNIYSRICSQTKKVLSVLFCSKCQVSLFQNSLSVAVSKVSIFSSCHW